MVQQPQQQDKTLIYLIVIIAVLAWLNGRGSKGGKLGKGGEDLDPLPDKQTSEDHRDLQNLGDECKKELQSVTTFSTPSDFKRMMRNVLKILDKLPTVQDLEYMTTYMGDIDSAGFSNGNLINVLNETLKRPECGEFRQQVKNKLFSYASYIS